MQCCLYCMIYNMVLWRRMAREESPYKWMMGRWTKSINMDKFLVCYKISRNPMRTIIIRDQYWPVKRSLGTGSDGCVCPSPASDHRVQRGGSNMVADGASDTSLQMLMMLQQMRDKIDRQISVKHGRDNTVPASGFSSLSPFRPSGITNLQFFIHNNSQRLF